jgi:hypothetical protein
MLRVTLGLAGLPLAFSCLAAMAPAATAAQGIPTATPTARACAYLPVAALEAHFGTKAVNVRGMDVSTQDWCSASFPDGRRGARVESHAPVPADLGRAARRQRGSRA